MMLKKGDKIAKLVHRHRGQKPLLANLIEIDRVTKTLACSGNLRFKRDCRDSNFFKEVSQSLFDAAHYAIATPDQIELAARHQLIEKIRTYNFEALTTNSLKKILYSFEWFDKLPIETTTKQTQS